VLWYVDIRSNVLYQLSGLNMEPARYSGYPHTTAHNIRRQITDSGLRKYKQNYVTYMWQVVSRVTTATCETLRVAKCHRPHQTSKYCCYSSPQLQLPLHYFRTSRNARRLHAALFYEVLTEDSSFSSYEGQSRAI